MDIEPGYQGREQAWVKHRLLESYLKTVLSIIAVTGKAASITYVDCFAGPWGDESEDLKGTSIAISLGIIDEVQKAYGSRGARPRITFQAIYVEKDRFSFGRLSVYLKDNTPAGIESFALPGDYFDQQDEILRLCGRSFTFFFVDPKGWTDVGIVRLSKLLRRPRSEFLINFMYDFFNRAIGMIKNRTQVEALIGALTEEELEWLDAADARTRSDYVVRKYRRELKSTMAVQDGNRPRSYHAEILNKDKDRLHYHLVYLTRHPKGILKFATESQRVDFLQLVVHQQTKNNLSIQTTMFSAEEDAEVRFDGRVRLRDVKDYWIARLSKTPIACDESFIADMLEETGWLLLDFEKALMELVADGLVENMDARGKRRTHPVHFEMRERLRLVSRG